MRCILEPVVSIIGGSGVKKLPHPWVIHDIIHSGRGRTTSGQSSYKKRKKLVSREVCANGSAEAAPYLWEDGSEDFDIFGLGGSVVLPVKGHTGLSNQGHQVELCIGLS